MREGERVLAGWGGAAGVTAEVIEPEGLDGMREALAGARAHRGGDGARSPASAIARGLGRSYGDAAQRRGGLVIRTRGLAGIELDHERGVVTVQAGVSLGELLSRCVPAGWMVPVVPGTQHVSVGGAIASDIHGKNHGTAGTFGRHVERMALLTSSGEVRELTPGDELFAATIGGMGLTGIVIWAQIRLRPVSSALLLVDTDRVSSLDEAFSALRAPGGPHRVAWLDPLGRRPGRGVVTRAEHLDSPPSDGADGSATVRARATVPRWFPAGVLRPATVGLFNELRYRLAPGRERGRAEGIGAHMFPLDALDAWPRLYGRHGFTQYQFAVPVNGEPVIEAVLERLRRRRVPCYLAVLKDFGPANETAPLSFPLEGWTLALDLPLAAPDLREALDACDELVSEAGGRVYLAKDVRLRPEMTAAMYPRLTEWRLVRERADPERLWCSDLALRTGIVEAGA